MKKNICIVFGGESTEHEVSLNSASNICNALDKELFQPILLGINKLGDWKYNPNYSTENISLSKLDFFEKAVPISLEKSGSNFSINDRKSGTSLATFDIAFPIIHGSGGEDGSLQGFFNMIDIPYIGSDVLGSSVCMDKDIAKRLFKESDIPVAKSITVRKRQKERISFEVANRELGLPMFIKPCNAGSSVGVTKVENAKMFDEAIEKAFQFDTKILIEEAVIGKEVECAVLGNDEPKASVMGEIIPTKDFYSYEAKYEDAEGAILQIPAKIPEEVAEKLRTLAIKAFETTACKGLARVDFFLRDDNTFVVNEINTLPGFTEISMYPKLWIETGLSYTNLITELIELALERHEYKNQLKTNRL